MMLKAGNAFLAQEGFALRPDWVDACSAYRQAMNAGLHGRSSLKMLPSYQKRPQIPAGTHRLALIDAGGTNLRAAQAQLDETAFCVSAMQSGRIPGSGCPVEADAFFDAVAQLLAPYLEGSEGVGFCFSYIFRSQPHGDGLVVQMAKQVRVNGIEGRSIAGELGAACRRRGLETPRKIAVLNDAVAVLLAGACKFQDEPLDEVVAMVLGTGINFSYFEQELDGMAVSLEASRYDGFEQTAADQALDALLEDPGQYPFEKSVAGRYLGALTHVLLKRACDAGLFSPQAAKRIRGAGELTTAQLSEILAAEPRDGGPDGDEQLFRMLGEAVVERAAWRIAVCLTAILKQTGKGRTAARPVGIVAEGSTFERFGLLRERLSAYLAHMAAQEGVYYRFLQVDNAVLLGTAAAALADMERMI